MVPIGMKNQPSVGQEESRGEQQSTGDNTSNEQTSLHLVVLRYKRVDNNEVLISRCYLSRIVMKTSNDYVRGSSDGMRKENAQCVLEVLIHRSHLGSGHAPLPNDLVRLLNHEWHDNLQ